MPISYPGEAPLMQVFETNIPEERKLNVRSLDVSKRAYCTSKQEYFGGYQMQSRMVTNMHFFTRVYIQKSK